MPAIELIIGDDGAIRISTALDDRGRFTAAGPEALGDGQYSLSINDLLIGSFTVDSEAQVAAATSQPADREPLLDIAGSSRIPRILAISPLGLGSSMVSTSRWKKKPRTAAAGGEATTQKIRETQRSLSDAGWLQRYENRLAVPSEGNPETFDVQVSSFVVEYVSGDHASAAFAALTGADAGVDFPLVGDESS